MHRHVAVSDVSVPEHVASAVCEEESHAAQVAHVASAEAEQATEIKLSAPHVVVHAVQVGSPPPATEA